MLSGRCFLAVRLPEDMRRSAESVRDDEACGEGGGMRSAWYKGEHWRTQRSSGRAQANFSDVLPW